MKLKHGLFQVVVVVAGVIFLLSGCGQSFELQKGDFSEPATFDSAKNFDPEYIDFSDLPLPEAFDKDVLAADEVPVVANPEVVAAETPSSQEKPVTPARGIGTVYYLPVYGEKRDCSKNEYAYLKDENEKILTRLCKTEVANCAMQGSCFYVDEEGVTLYAYKKMVKIKVPQTEKMISQPRFRPNKNFPVCPQGMGAHMICLDPYRSVAADPKFHKMGDVIFVPILRGQKLPNGETHDGYLVVRDTGGAIKGEGRFDFFIGFDEYRKHLFMELQLGTKKEFIYYRVPVVDSAKVRQLRNYPKAPVSVHEKAYEGMMEALGLVTFSAQGRGK